MRACLHTGPQRTDRACMHACSSSQAGKACLPGLIPYVLQDHDRQAHMPAYLRGCLPLSTTEETDRQACMHANSQPTRLACMHAHPWLTVWAYPHARMHACRPSPVNGYACMHTRRAACNLLARRVAHTHACMQALSPQSHACMPTRRAVRDPLIGMHACMLACRRRTV